MMLGDEYFYTSIYKYSLWSHLESFVFRLCLPVCLCCRYSELEFMPEPRSPIRCRIVEFFHDVDRLGLRRRRQLMKKLENWFLDPWDFLIERGSAGNNEKETKSINVRGLKALFCCSSTRILRFMVSKDCCILQYFCSCWKVKSGEKCWMRERSISVSALGRDGSTSTASNRGQYQSKCKLSQETQSQKPKWGQQGALSTI